MGRTSLVTSGIDKYLTLPCFRGLVGCLYGWLVGGWLGGLVG